MKKKKRHHSKKELGSLIDKNYGLLVNQVKSFRPKTKHDRDEYFQVGYIGMIKGIKTFNPDKGEFSTYITTCIRNEIINFLKKENKHKFLIDLSLIQYPSKSYNNIWEFIPDNIDNTELEIICLRLNGCSRKEIAEELNYTENQVRYIVRNLMEKIRAANGKKD